MMTDAYSSRRAQQRKMIDADQAEFAAVAHGSAVTDAGIYDQRVAGAMDDFAPRGVTTGTTWQERDLESDTAVGGIQEEVLRRQDAMGDAYPFAISGNKISYVESETGFYEFCLATSLAPSLSRGQYAKLPKAFERITTILVKDYFGSHSAAVHTGTPRETAVGKKFVDAMAHLNKLSGEWVWSPWNGLPDVPQTTGDEGIDFVVWKKPLDGRFGNLFVLGQCACGDDWDTKLKDIDLQRLEKWFHPLSYAPPVRAFATPHHICDQWLPHVLTSAGLLFDRARLSIIAAGATSNEELTAWKDSIKKLTTFTLGEAKNAA